MRILQPHDKAHSQKPATTTICLLQAAPFGQRWPPTCIGNVQAETAGSSSASANASHCTTCAFSASVPPRSCSLATNQAIALLSAIQAPSAASNAGTCGGRTVVTVSRWTGLQGGATTTMMIGVLGWRQTAWRTWQQLRRRRTINETVIITIAWHDYAAFRPLMKCTVQCTRRVDN